MNTDAAFGYLPLAAGIWVVFLAALLLVPHALIRWSSPGRSKPQKGKEATAPAEQVAGYRDLLLKSATGVAAVITFVYAIDSAKEQLAQNREQAAIAVFKDAIDRLVMQGANGGADGVARAGAIYMLGELVKQNSHLQKPVMHTLAGIIRQTSSRSGEDPKARVTPVAADI